MCRTNDADMSILDDTVRPFVVVKRDAGKGEVAAPLREFLEGPAPRGGPRRKMDRRDELVVGQTGCERTQEEILCADLPRACPSHDLDPRVAGGRNARHFGGRIGMREAAADRAAIADLIVGDVTDGSRDQRTGAAQTGMVFQFAPPHHRADRYAGFADRDVVKSRDAAQVDEHTWIGQAKGQDWNKTLAARDRFCRARTVRQYLHSLPERRRSLVVERRQLHVTIPARPAYCGSRFPNLARTSRSSSSLARTTIGKVARRPNGLQASITTRALRGSVSE